MKQIVIAVVAGLCFLASNAQAATHVLTAKGRVSSIAALQDFEPVMTPAGQIFVGDEFELEASFDVNQAKVTELFNEDPSINIYYLPGTVVKASIGSYSTTFTPRFSSGASLQIWDNFDSGGPVDIQSFGFFNFDFTPLGQYPFELGDGQVSERFGFQAFDRTATARSSDLISELAPLSAFSTQLLNYGLLNSDNDLFVSVQASIIEANLLAVPEPATWAFMIFGFGAVGGALRHQRKTGVKYSIA